MMPTRKMLVLQGSLVCVLLHTVGAWAQFTNPRPMLRAADKYFAMLLKSDFDGLERTAAEARSKDLRIEDGQPVLAALYEGTAGCPCANSLTDQLWQVRRARLEAWTKQFPQSTTARVALASFPVYYGWFARGNNYGNTVSPDAWKLFGERVEQGRAALDALDPSAKQDQGWYAAMISIALAQHWPSQRFDALYQEAARKHPTYLPIHFNAANYYTPQWYGSQQAYKRFLQRATDLVGPPTDAELYARLNWSYGADDSDFKDGTVDWARMKSGFEQMTKGYPDPWNLNNFARFACMAHDAYTVNAIANTIGDTPIAMAWWNDPSYYFRCRDFARQQMK